MARDKKYVDGPVVVAFKTSNRSNAQTKLKVTNHTIDDLIEFKVPGIPNDAIILDIGIGEQYIKKYETKYNL